MRSKAPKVTQVLNMRPLHVRIFNWKKTYSCRGTFRGQHAKTSALKSLASTSGAGLNIGLTASVPGPQLAEVRSQVDWFFNTISRVIMSNAIEKLGGSFSALKVDHLPEQLCESCRSCPFDNSVSHSVAARVNDYQIDP